MKKTVFALMLCVTSTGSAYAFDQKLSEHYQEMTSKMDQAAFAKSTGNITATKVLEMMAKKEDFVFLDVRTPAEQAILGITYKNTLNIPMNELFKAENLARLPTNKPIIVVCHGWSRSVGATAMLKSVGFNNAIFLKGGLVDLVTATTPATAPEK